MSVIDGIEFEELNKETVMKRTPILSVWCLTYNHVNYIRDCLDGILAQKTDFKFEVVILDDASNDGTTDIIREYCVKYPLIFHAFIAKENTYIKQKNIQIGLKIIAENMRGEYAAICEGDDYWCDPHKLQIQVDFLRNHPDFTLIMHNAKRVNYKTGITDLMKGDETSHEIMPEEIIGQRSGIWPTASMVGKKEVWICEPFFFDCGIGDWPMQLYAAAKGRIYYINKTMSVYRYMTPGSWSVQMVSEKKKNLFHSAKMVKFLCEYDNYTEKKYHDDIVARINGFYYSNINCSEKEEIINKLINDVNRETNKQYQVYFDNLSKLNKQINDLFFISEDILNIIVSQKEIFIMGKGRYSNILTQQLKNHDVEILGYVLSDDQKIIGDNVISLSEFEKNFSNAQLIVGIGVSYYIEILNNLRMRKINNYVFPFVVDGEIIQK